jgi:hypothetical protein
MPTTGRRPITESCTALELRLRPVSREHARPQTRPAGCRRYGGGTEEPAPVPVGGGHRPPNPAAQGPSWTPPDPDQTQPGPTPHWTQRAHGGQAISPPSWPAWGALSVIKGRAIVGLIKYQKPEPKAENRHTGGEGKAQGGVQVLYFPAYFYHLITHRCFEWGSKLEIRSGYT